MKTVALALLAVSSLCVLGCNDDKPAPKPATAAATAAAPATSASAAAKKAPGGGW